MNSVCYDKKEDILSVQLSTKKYWKSVEIAHNVVVDISKAGEITGFEIPDGLDSRSADPQRV
jgi:uncharacterized protein YuzE